MAAAGRGSGVACAGRASARYPLCRQVELLERVEPLVGIPAHEPAHARDALAELADLGKVADTGWHLRAAPGAQEALRPV